jgi:hypothetical protein
LKPQRRSLLKDAQGNVIAQDHISAQGDWMTSDFVPFTATLSPSLLSLQALKELWSSETTTPPATPQETKPSKFPFTF